ncbi:MAG: hypothetical protein GXY44_04155 [Phycisphaerales bacterium]|nr:hypothetical protein [Phycisphaerales bacterium]
MKWTSSRFIGLALCPAVVLFGMFVWLSGCSVSIDSSSGGVAFSFLIAGRSFTFTLGPAGYFPLQPGAIVRNVADLQPFDRPPSDTPATGAVRLRGSSITILPPNAAAKSLVAAQSSVSGTARLRVAIDAPGALSPCESGLDLGEFEIVVANGVITSVGPGLPLRLAAVDYFNRNDLAMCLEMTSDFAAGLQIAGLDVTFGPSQSGAGEGFRAMFERRNLESSPIHLLAPGEEFSEANRIWIGTPPPLAIDNLTINGLVTFRAGRDGQVLDTVTCPPVRYGGYYAFVEWDGTSLHCYEPTFTPQSTEACCMPPLPGYELDDRTYADSLRCEDLGSRPDFTTREDCRLWGGVPRGAGTTCASVTCDEPFSACCIGTSCHELLFAECQALGGIYQGTGSHCEFLSCAQDDVWGACCYDGDRCIEIPYAWCVDIGGDYLGDETSCDACPSSGPLSSEEACCFYDEGVCQDGDAELCVLLGGTSQGLGTTCQTTPGACCLPDGSCRLVTEQQCTELRGSYLGECTQCNPNPCQNLVGACCWSSQCILTSAVDCSELGGTYIGEGSTCNPDPCAPPGPDKEYVVWYTGNVCCWGAPRIYISTRAEFLQVGWTCYLPGGGIDCTIPIVRVELRGGFSSQEAAQAWLYPRFESKIFHYWCGGHYQMDGKNWWVAPCSNWADLPDLPESARLDTNMCQ